MKIYAYGDSFVAGDQDIPGRIDAIEENMEFNRYNVSFASVLAKKLNVELVNRAISGCSNLVQLDSLWADSDSIKPDDLVLFGFSSLLRDRFTILYEKNPLITKLKGPRILNHELFKECGHRFLFADFFYILSTIEKLEEIYNFKVIKFNNFHNVFDDGDDEFRDQQKFKFERFIGLHTPGNTLLDVLTDNWGNNTKRIPAHNQWKPHKNQHLFTKNIHPNIQGHIKIADWLYDNLKKNNWI